MARSCPLEEHRAKVGIVNVEVTVIHVDGLVPRELEMSVDLLALKGLCFLLPADKNNTVVDAALLPESVGECRLCVPGG